MMQTIVYLLFAMVLAYPAFAEDTPKSEQVCVVTNVSFYSMLLFPNELHNGGHASVELPFNNLSLDFLAKNDLTIREFFRDVQSGHQHIKIFGATCVPRQLRLCVSFEENDSSGLQALLNQRVQSPSNITR